MTLKPGHNYLELARRINAAAVDPTSWQPVVSLMAEMAGDIRTHLFGFDMIVGQTGPLHVTHGYDPEFMEGYNRNYTTRNAWAPGFLRGAPGQVMTSAQMCPDAALRRTEFYADWVRPQEDIIAGGGSVLLRDPTRLYVLGGNIRNRDGERLQPGWTRLLNDFVPLLQQALEMNRTLAGARLGNYLLRHQLDPDTAAVLILTAEGRPVSVDPRAATLLEAGEVLRLTPSGTAAFTDPHAESRLTALRRQAGRVAQHSFGLRAPDGAEWRCNLAVLSAEEDLARLLGSAFFVPPPLIVLALTRPQVQRPPRSRLGAALSLTPAESAVALMLAEGLSPVEIADQRGTRLVTVRNQIKQAMWKADCRRQVDLVRRVLTLTGPGTGPASAAPHRPQ